MLHLIPQYHNCCYYQSIRLFVQIRSVCYKVPNDHFLNVQIISLTLLNEGGGNFLYSSLHDGTDAYYFAVTPCRFEH